MINQFRPEWLLRLGLGLMYLRSGAALWFGSGLTDNLFRAQGVLELILGVVFLAFIFPRRLVAWAALASTLELLLILFYTAFDYQTITWQSLNVLLAAIDADAFRQVGALGAAGALYLLSRRV